jgi:hypothetical protein
MDLLPCRTARAVFVYSESSLLRESVLRESVLRESVLREPGSASLCREMRISADHPSPGDRLRAQCGMIAEF